MSNFDDRAVPIDVLGSNQSLIRCRWTGQFSPCRGCGRSIAFAKTKNDKWIPIDSIGKDSEPATPHWKTCTKAKDFRGKQ